MLSLLYGGCCRLWQEVLLLFIHLDSWANWLVRLVWRPKYVLSGKCQQRGTCCTCIRFSPPRFVLQQAPLLRLALWYHHWMHAFVPYGRTDTGDILFRCNHLRRDGKCGIYRYRPRLCRDYPKVPLFGPPRLLPGCGFRTAAREVVAMRPRANLVILNATTEVHHPTPPFSKQPQPERLEDFHQIDPHVLPKGK